MRLTSVAIAFAALTAVFGPTGAIAHAHLDHATPAVGSVVTDPPKEVHLWFSEALEPRFSKAELRSGAGAVLATGGADPADRKALIVPVSDLKPGKYKVIWRVISTDTHRSEGDFSFEIKP
jgi:methionine-rich copper-binding protein CopC